MHYVRILEYTLAHVRYFVLSLQRCGIYMHVQVRVFLTLAIANIVG